EAGYEAENDPEAQRQRHHHDADEEREPRAVEEPRENVAADRIGAERISERSALLPEGWLQEGIVVGQDRRGRRDEAGRGGEGKDRQDDDEPGDGAGIGAEVSPELAQRVRRSARHRFGGLSR